MKIAQSSRIFRNIFNDTLCSMKDDRLLLIVLRTTETYFLCFLVTVLFSDLINGHEVVIVEINYGINLSNLELFCLVC